MMHKKNTFTDFIACAEYLLAQGYGSKDRLVIEGRSAGGLLMGAVLNIRPDLFHAAERCFVFALAQMPRGRLPEADFTTTSARKTSERPVNLNNRTVAYQRR